MKIFVAGATGAVGKRLIPELVARGHDVIGTTRSAEKVDLVRRLGAQPVVLDGLDAEGTMRAVAAAKPDVIVHQLTALSRFKDLKRFDDGFAETNRLRSEGLDHLLAAARAAGARRVLAQSFTGWPNIREGGPVKTEADPLDPNPPAAMSRTLDAIRYLEETLTSASDIEGLALRYGFFYGPGTSFGPDVEYPNQIRQGRLPVVGDGAGVWSFTHIDDAAGATIAALERGAPGVYNVVDDEPAPVSLWLPYLAELLGAKPPRHVPTWLARLLIGDAGVSTMTRIRGSANAKAKRELGWEPRFPSWREGFRQELASPEPSRPAVSGGLRRVA